MEGRTLVAVFNEQTVAQQALDALRKAGFAKEQAHLTAPGGATGSTATREKGDEKSIGEKIAAFFGFGEHHEATYSEAVRQGNYVLVVDAADESEVDRACDIIDEFDPADIEQQQSQWRQSGWQSPQTATGAETTIPVVEEQLQVGKRTVERGGIRVISRVTDRPVEQTVNLREERATVMRRPVDRVTTDSDQPFNEQSFEVRETTEEPVVGKTARVVEEVVVAKESGTREQTVKGNVRKTEVHVEQSRGEKPGSYRGEDRRRSTASYEGMDRRAP